MVACVVVIITFLLKDERARGTAAAAMAGYSRATAACSEREAQLVSDVIRLGTSCFVLGC